MDKEKILKKLFNKKAFFAVVSLIVIIFNAFGLYEVTGVDETTLESFFTALFAVLVAVGIYSNTD